LGTLPGLTTLHLSVNPIVDIGVLGALTKLTTLQFSSSPILDIGALSGLTSLTFLDLNSNPNLSRIQPLLDNAGLGGGDTVRLNGTSVSCTDVAALVGKGVTVTSDCL